MVAISKKLGKGIYSPRDAALYARVKTQLMSRWILGNSQGKPVVKREIEDSSDSTVTFLDFIQALSIRAIRTQYSHIPLQKIREAANTATEKYEVEYPFARPHSTYIIKKGRNTGEIVLRLGDDDDRFVQITGKMKDQHLLGPIAELYMENIKYDEDDYASEYRPWSTLEGGAILMNPHRRFGEPLVEECGYSARALWEAAITEGGIEAAANSYGVEPAHVKLACNYFDHLTNASS